MWIAERNRFIDEFVIPRGLSPDYPLPAHACELIDGRVLDLGAGFTSVVVRVMGLDVATVEHDPWFMSEIKDYCIGRGLNGGEWYTIEAWRNGHAGRYDTVIVDQGPGMDDRLRDMRRVNDQLLPGGKVILDDWRKGYRAEMRNRLEQMNYHIEPITGEYRPVAVARRKT